LATNPEASYLTMTRTIACEHKEQMFNHHHDEIFDNYSSCRTVLISHKKGNVRQKLVSGFWAPKITDWWAFFSALFGRR